MLIYKLRLYNSAVKLPKFIRQFLLKLFGLIIIWELCYNFILKPLRIPDKILTDFVTIAVTACLNFFFNKVPLANWIAEAAQPANAIQQNGKSFFFIYDACNGLDLIIIYLGFIILLPATIARKLTFGLAGIIALSILNIARCVLLYYIYVNHRSLFEINHHYIFTIVMYLFIFYAWVLFTKKTKTA